MNDPTDAGSAHFAPDRIWNSSEIVDLRDRARGVRNAFANYLDGTGRDAHTIAVELIAILDAMERRLPRDVDEVTLKQITEDFDAYAKKRAADLIGRDALRDDHLRKIAETAFCLGYKAGVVDLSATQRGT
jgi:hypothetical protein